MARKKLANDGADLGFEEKLWLAADKLRGSMDAAEYKHVVLGLVFLKYISDAFEEQRAKIAAVAGADPEDRDEYRANNVFGVPMAARWTRTGDVPGIQDNARAPRIGKFVDDAMDAIEKENPGLKRVLPKDYASPDLDKTRLGELIDLISTIGMGDEASRSKDILGRIYEYFLGKFANAEGKGGGEFYTPRSTDWLIVSMLAPSKGRVYDPCVGAGGTLVLCQDYVRSHGGKSTDISVFGQEANPTTWRLCKMNHTIRGIECNLGQRNADTFLDDLHKDLRADYIVAGPPFNLSAWGGERLREDSRWKYGAPPVGNANFAWVQHLVAHLAPSGVAGVVLANGSMSSSQAGAGDIRKAIVEADLLDCMIALPGQLFYLTQIPACLWFFARSKSNGRFRRRHGETLFIDARKLGRMVDRTRRELTDEEIARIATAYHAWRGEKEAGEYADVPGFCKAAKLAEIASHGYVLTPGRYVGAEEIEDDGEPFGEKMARLTAKLEEQFAESGRLEQAIRANLRGLGFKTGENQ
jgi:type I restriction enzyme M protein